MTTVVEPGDELKGEKVAVQARKINKPQEFRMTGGHNGHRFVVERNVTCTILKKTVISKGG